MARDCGTLQLLDAIVALGKHDSALQAALNAAGLPSVLTWLLRRGRGSELRGRALQLLAALQQEAPEMLSHDFAQALVHVRGFQADAALPSATNSVFVNACF